MTQPPLKWHGGKHYLAPKIVALMPPHLHYVEPYFGGGSVLLAKDPEGVSEVVNDLDARLTQFWSVLQDQSQFDLFRRRMEATPFSEQEWSLAKSGVEVPVGQLEPWESAACFFVACRQSMSGRMRNFSPITRRRTRRGMNEQASAWMSCVDGLPEVHARLRRVVIVGPKDALEVIRQQDGPQTLFYLDPPYVHETRNGHTPNDYSHEMTDAQHLGLLSLLADIEGKWMLSGYPSKLYQSFFKDLPHSLYTFDMPNNAAWAIDKRRMTECLWCNF